MSLPPRRPGYDYEQIRRAITDDPEWLSTPFAGGTVDHIFSDAPNMEEVRGLSRDIPFVPFIGTREDVTDLSAVTTVSLNDTFDMAEIEMQELNPVVSQEVAAQIARYMDSVIERLGLPASALDMSQLRHGGLPRMAQPVTPPEPAMSSLSKGKRKINLSDD